MMSNSLASITAQYTDSENEDENHDDESTDSQNSPSAQVAQKAPTPVASPAPEKGKRPAKSLRLVSYQDDTIISEDEAESESDEDENESSPVIPDNSYKDEKKSTPTEEPTTMEVDDDPSGSKVTPQKEVKIEKYAHYGFNLPPEPKGKPASELVEKIRHLYDKMENSNMDMNRIIQERKDFRNPSIYEKLISFCDINEFGTNYPPEIYDPLQWGPESYYEALAKVQKAEMAKRQKEKKENDKIEQATAAARKVEEEAKKRKSKWDQPAPIKTAPPALTTTVTGTKGTVISAFGSLPKKTNI